MHPRRGKLAFDISRVLHSHYIVTWLVLLQSPEGQSWVGPSQTIVATVGEDIILPCHLKPAKDASALLLQWVRPDLSPGFVFVWNNGSEDITDKQPSYGGRTSLMTDKLKIGNVSLKLSNVTLSDEGMYKCRAPQLGYVAAIKLLVSAASTVSITVLKEFSSRVELQCESAGWFPEPEVLWLDDEENLLSAGPTETVRGPDGLYNVSSRVTVEKTHNSFTCRVHQRKTNQSRETHIHVPASSKYVKVVLVLGLIGVILCAMSKIYECTFRRGKNDQTTCLGKDTSEKTDTLKMQKKKKKRGKKRKSQIRRQQDSGYLQKNEDKWRKNAKREEVKSCVNPAIRYSCIATDT